MYTRPGSGGQSRVERRQGEGLGKVGETGRDERFELRYRSHRLIMVQRDKVEVTAVRLLS